MSINYKKIFIGAGIFYLLTSKGVIDNTASTVKDIVKPEAEKSQNKSASQKEQLRFGKSKEAKFVEKLYPVAVKFQENHGIPLEYLITTAALETGWEIGSRPQHKVNNLWGLKARDGDKFVEVETDEYINGKRVKVLQKFLACQSLEECATEYAARLKTYTRERRLADSVWRNKPLEALDIMLKKYATDPGYADKYKQVLIKVTDIIEEAREVKNSNFRVKGDTIIIAAGHTIDPGPQLGAATEMEKNIAIAWHLERILKASGWNVVRPDAFFINDLASTDRWEHLKKYVPELSEQNKMNFSRWGSYMNWGDKQVDEGKPWIEVHGQPRRFRQGTICHRKVILHSRYCQMIINEIGLLNVDPNNYSITRAERGGIITESFASDEPIDPLEHAKMIARGINNAAAIEKK